MKKKKSNTSAVTNLGVLFLEKNNMISTKMKL